MSFIRLYIYILFNARRQPCTIQKSWCQLERMSLGYRCKGRIRLISSTSPPDSKILERFHDQALGNVVLGYSITQPALGLLEGGSRLNSPCKLYENCLSESVGIISVGHGVTGILGLARMMIQIRTSILSCKTIQVLETKFYLRLWCLCKKNYMSNCTSPLPQIQSDEGYGAITGSIIRWPSHRHCVW